jgi:hypothetical protein
MYDSNGNQLSLDISELEGFVMGTSHGNFSTNVNGDIMHNSDPANAASTATDTMTAATMLWGRGPMTTAPMTTSAPSLLPSTGQEQRTKPNSPSSNAAAALLVGMSMRKEHEANTLPNAKQGSKANAKTSSSSTEANQAEGTFDVEAKWREVRVKVSQQTFRVAQAKDPEEEPLEEEELPKGVTRRPSGAWQAQIYFAGKTRYIGVWERSQDAATAYNLAKDALKELKAQQKRNAAFRKRQYQRPAPIDTTRSPRNPVMATPNKDSNNSHLPSISWPSSASSSSTVSSSGGPFKKRKANDHGSPEAYIATPQVLSQHQGATAPLPPPRGHPFSAFSSQHLHKQQQQQHNGPPQANLTHPALQLLSLRPPQSSQHAAPPPQAGMWMHPQPQYHHPQRYHARPPFPYGQPFPNNSNNNGMNPLTAMQGGSQNAPSMTKGKAAKSNGFKCSSSACASSNRKKSKAKTIGSYSREKDHEREAQNAKWKAVRAEVVAIFDEARRGEGTKGETPTKKIFDKETLRGITVRPSGKFQAQLYFRGRSRYIGVFDSEYEAASAYEMIRSRLKDGAPPKGSPLSPSSLTSTSTTASTSMMVSGVPPTAKDDKDEDAKSADTAETTSVMRSITPSPTPLGDGRGEGIKIAS